MITRDRLAQSDYGKGLLSLFTTLRKYRITDWGNDDSDDRAANRPEDRREVHVLTEADVVGSVLVNSDPPLTGTGSATDELLNDTRHALVIDIDHPSWLIPSTTPGHYHLYVNVPSGIPDDAWRQLMVALARAGVIETGYKGASLDRGFSCVRMPWIDKPAKKGDSDA